MDWAQWLAVGMIGAASVIFLPMWAIGALQAFLEHRRALRQGGADMEAIVKQLQALREEIAQLRETSTQYDMSLQANLENLQERVRLLEAEQLLHRNH